MMLVVVVVVVMVVVVVVVVVCVYVGLHISTLLSAVFLQLIIIPVTSHVCEPFGQVNF